ncbi:MAG: hypothetical protein JEZ05_06555 [Tenericutes bacterium]|nr:hypothetical protein [Mycoplasmatota bacterium]MBI9009677.1 hypothetical protein [Mycoplasmatota bacterium]
MNTNLQLIPSGFSLIDEKWGGLYIGGSYLIIGSRKTGRTLLSLQCAMESAKNQQVCLYFTNMRPKDLMIQAASINFDIQTYMNRNQIIVVRVASPDDVYDQPNQDEFLIEYMNDIITVVNHYQPHRIIFDELTPYIGFNSLDLLKDVFVHTLENLGSKDITSLFLVGEPATSRSREIVDTLSHEVTANIYLKNAENASPNENRKGTISIVPNIGHTEGAYTEDFEVEPYIGLTIPKLMKEESSDFEYPSSREEDHQIQNLRKTKLDNIAEPYSFSNLYEYPDFELLLNNQIALFRSTGQVFDLIAFKLDHVFRIQGHLTVNELKEALRLSTDKKDKICVIDNKVIVLVVKSDSKSAQNILFSIKYHFPSEDKNYLNSVLENISVLSIEVDENIDNAKTMLNYIASSDEDVEKNYIPLKNFVE